MTISTAHYREQELTAGRSITSARGPTTGSSVVRLEERMGLSQTQPANCALTWYAYFDTQLRAGYSLTFWNERGKASPVSLTAGPPANVESTRLAPTAGKAPASASCLFRQRELRPTAPAPGSFRAR